MGEGLLELLDVVVEGLRELAGGARLDAAQRVRPVWLRPLGKWWPAWPQSRRAKWWTRHELARELRVTTRALYNHVRDRQEVVDLAAQRMVEGLPQTQWDARRWRESLREGYEEARAAYRRIPRAVLVSLDETVTPGEVPAARFLLAESMLTFFTDIGLSLEWAVAMRGAFLSDVFAHALLIDYRYDRGNEAVRQAMGQPIPAAWLEAQPDVEAPLSRGVISLPSPTSDDMFAAVVDLRIAAIERLLEEGV